MTSHNSSRCPERHLTSTTIVRRAEIPRWYAKEEVGQIKAPSAHLTGTGSSTALLS